MTLVMLLKGKKGTVETVKEGQCQVWEKGSTQKPTRFSLDFKSVLLLAKGRRLEAMGISKKTMI